MLRISTQQNGYQPRFDEIPRITVNTPACKSPPVTIFPVEKSPISVIDTSRSSDHFETARTSREEEANSYSSMEQLVRTIRSEAGLTDTPRPETPTTPISAYQLLHEMHVSELRIGKYSAHRAFSGPRRAPVSYESVSPKGA